MSDGVQNMKIKLEMLLILISLVSLTTAIRVTFNTNPITGPIPPPSTTVPPIPKPPFREPAPVWENQDDDLVNPNPYRYVLPPPSRPKLLDDNYARAPSQDDYRYQNTQPNYGQVITKYSDIDGNYIGKQTVPTLAVQHIPNVGLKYFAVIPSSSSKSYYLKENDVYDDKYKTKLNGKYNPKLKKYKAYEKMKYNTPHLYYYKSVGQQKLSNTPPLPYATRGTSFINQPINNNRQPLHTQISISHANKTSHKYQKNLATANADLPSKQWSNNSSSSTINALPTSSKPER